MHYLYSKNIQRFINDIQKQIGEILSLELKLRVRGDRFYDKSERCSYPIRVVIHNNKSSIGYFDPNFYELGFHESLMRVKSEVLKNVIRHELAHYMTFIVHGGELTPHSREFRTFCLEHGWGEDVIRATMKVEEMEGAVEEESLAIQRKIEKLLALSESSNPNEAEAALLKSQELLFKYNIELKYLGHEKEEKMVLKRILKRGKQDTKMQAIAHILPSFFVSCVYTRSTDAIYLEILGTSINVEIAEYVANYLDQELERLWKNVQMTTPLSGLVAKNSFFLGLAKGYCTKAEALKRQQYASQGKALLVLEKELEEVKAAVYKRLKTTRSHRQHCTTSSSLGEQMGKALSIQPAVKGGSLNFLPY